MTFAPLRMPFSRPSGATVPRAVVAGRRMFGFIRRIIERRKQVSSAVPAGKSAKGVSLCGIILPEVYDTAHALGRYLVNNGGNN